MKNNKIKTFSNAAIIRLKNKRITILENGDDKMILNFRFADTEAEKPACSHICHKGKVRETTISLSNEAMEAMVLGWIYYKQEKVNLAKNSKIANEGDSRFIHTTIGVYANGDMKVNGMRTENLKEHIAYNIENRWGRALFVNGACVHRGNLSNEQISFHEKLFKSDSKYTRTKDSAPYQ